MGKKINSTTEVLSTKQQLNQAFLKLERHLFRTNSKSINTLIQVSHQNISYPTYEKCKDLLRQTKKQGQLAIIPKSSGQSFQDSDDLLSQIKRKERLPTQFSQMLDRSESSYERTSLILRNLSLRQKYGHLLGETQPQEQKVDQNLSEEQLQALNRLKKLYKHYKVSNMFKKNVYAKIKKCYVQKLVKKGFIRQSKNILTLKS